jgi:hypothetical protein
MADLSLQLDKAALGTAAYGDLVIVNGDAVLTSDANGGGTQNVLQDIVTRLRAFSGEWFLDTAFGIGWFQRVFIKGPNVSAIDGELRDAILATPGVLALTQYKSTPNYSARTFTVSFTVATTAGTVSYSLPVTATGVPS